jgi:hypothetical protein
MQVKNGTVFWFGFFFKPGFLWKKICIKCCINQKERNVAEGKNNVELFRPIGQTVAKKVQYLLQPDFPPMLGYVFCQSILK